MAGMVNIQSLFTGRVVAECCRIEHRDCELYPEERVSLHHAVARRRHEFGSGRVCARNAMARLGIKDSPLPRSPEGLPVWPAGIVGVISHSTTWCGAAVGRQEDIRGIGLDIETIDRVSMRIAKKVLTPAEYAWITTCSQEAQMRLALLFSAKETLFKCVSPVYGKRFGFYDMAITQVTQEEQSFEVKLDHTLSASLPHCITLTGRYCIHEGDVFTGMVLSRED